MRLKIGELLDAEVRQFKYIELKNPTSGPAYNRARDRSRQKHPPIFRLNMCENFKEILSREKLAVLSNYHPFAGIIAKNVKIVFSFQK
jgi:hypothetical protein